MGVVEGLIGVGLSLYSANRKKKAAKQEAAAIAAGQVDPNRVADDAREQAIRNMRASYAAEQEFAPENAALRRGATEALLPLVNDTGAAAEIAGVEEQIAAGGDAAESELLTESIAQARSDLALGGTLDSETRNEITRRSVAAGGNTGAARFTTPRDLGRTSLSLATERLERGGRFGQVDQRRNQQSFDNLSRLRSLREQLSAGRTSRGLALAGFGQSLQAPDVGLAPGEFAGLAIGNQNIMSEAMARKAQASAQNADNYGQAILAGVGAIGQIPKVKSYFSKGNALPEVSTT